MPRLLDITAAPTHIGAVLLRWRGEGLAAAGGIAVVRRETNYPISPLDGDLVADLPGGPSGPYEVLDRPPHPERVYYYGLFPYQRPADPLAPALAAGLDERVVSDELWKLIGTQFGEPGAGALIQIVTPGRTWVLADPANGRVLVLSLLPSALQATAYNVAPPYRTAARTTAAYDLAGLMYRLLPALYQRYDRATNPDQPDGPGPLRTFLELPGRQLDQIYSLIRSLDDLHDPARVDGRLLPLLAAWIGWPTDFRQELADQRNELREAPFIYRRIGIIPTVEATVKRVIGWESRVKEFSQQVLLSNQPATLNLWGMVRDGARAWATLPDQPLSLDFAYDGRPALAQYGGRTWLFYHTRRQEQWELWAKQSPDGREWSPSRPLVAGRSGRTERSPWAVAWAGRLWVFWESFGNDTLPTSGDTPERWSIWYLSITASGVSQPLRLGEAGERRSPVAAVDGRGGLLLVWREAAGDGWRLVYTRIEAAPTIQATGRIPAAPPAVELGHSEAEDLFALGHPDGSIWLLWAYRAAGAGQTRWRIAYRRLAASTAALPPASAWSPPVTLATPALGDDEREPGALPAAGGIELFWSGTRAGNWSIWSGSLASGGASVANAQRLTLSPAQHRGPAPLDGAGHTLLVYRSAESLSYSSPTYGATTTLDSRYAGSASVDTRNLVQLGRRGSYTDTLTYSYDTRTDEEAWYARDTVGIYLRPTVDTQREITRGRKLIEGLIRRYLPIQVRVVFIIEQPVYDESLYPELRPLGERTTAELRTPSVESYGGVAESHSDRAPGWRFVRTWTEGRDGGRSADTRRQPTIGGRSWQAGIEEGT